MMVVSDAVGMSMLGLRLELEKLLRKLKPKPLFRYGYDEDHERFTVEPPNKAWKRTITNRRDIGDFLAFLKKGNPA